MESMITDELIFTLSGEQMQAGEMSTIRQGKKVNTFCMKMSHFVLFLRYYYQRVCEQAPFSCIALYEGDLR